MITRRTVVTAVGFATLAFGLPARAQAPPASTVMDVTVVDAKGEPVAALTADRFRVQVGGRSQQVVAAELVRADPAAGRSLVLVIDQSSVLPGAEAPLIDVARQLVGRLAPGDRVGLMVVPEPGPRVPLTTDHRSVIESAGQVKGRREMDPAAGRIGLGEALAMADGDPLAIGAVSDRDCVGIGDTIKAQNGMETGWLEQPVGECFKRIMRTADRIAAEAQKAGQSVVPGVVEGLGSLADAPGARAVILVTSGLATGRRDPALADMTARAAAAGASVHALLVDPAVQKVRGVPVNRQTERRGLEQRLDELTIAARGHAALATPQSVDLFDRLLRETGGYYRLTVALDEGSNAAARPGRRQAGLVRVDVTGGRFTVRARPFLYDPAAESNATPMSREDRIAAALGAGGVRTSALPVRVAAALRVGPNKTTSVVISGEVDVEGGDAAAGPAPSDQAGAEAEHVSLSYALFDKDRQPVAAGPLPAGAASRKGAPQSFAGRLGGITPGRYMLRLAAIDGAGRMGSAERELDLRIVEAGGLTAGDVLLARTTRGETEAAPSIDEIAVDSGLLMQVDVAGDASSRRALGGAFVLRPRGGGAAVMTLPAKSVADEQAGLARIVTNVEAGLLAPGDYEVIAELKGGSAVLTAGPRALTIVPAASSGSGAFSREWLSSLTPAFSRAAVLDTNVLRPVITRLQSRASAPAVQTALARALEAKPEAIAVDGALRKQDPVAAAFLSGVALFARGELEPAAVQFREALRVDAEFAPAIVYLGACYAAGGRDREAAGAWQTALISETEDAVLPALLADAWLRVDDAEAALEILDEAIGRWPDDRELSGRRVTALLAQGRVADGLTALDAHVGASADQLLAGMRLIVEAHMVRKPIASPESDRERLQKYADRYRAANGPQQALVSSWLANWP